MSTKVRKYESTKVRKYESTTVRQYEIGDDEVQGLRTSPPLHFLGLSEHNRKRPPPRGCHGSDGFWSDEIATSGAEGHSGSVTRTHDHLHWLATWQARGNNRMSTGDVIIKRCLRKRLGGLSRQRIKNPKEKGGHPHCFFVCRTMCLGVSTLRSSQNPGKST